MFSHDVWSREIWYYLLSRHTLVETDQSQREQIFNQNIAEALAWFQRLLFMCTTFDNEVKYRRGETTCVADTLSGVCTAIEVIEVKNQRESCASKYSIHFITDTSCPIDIGLVKLAQWRTQQCSYTVTSETHEWSNDRPDYVWCNTLCLIYLNL